MRNEKSGVSVDKEEDGGHEGEECKEKEARSNVVARKGQRTERGKVSNIPQQSPQLSV